MFTIPPPPPPPPPSPPYKLEQMLLVCKPSPGGVPIICILSYNSLLCVGAIGLPETSATRQNTFFLPTANLES